MDEKMIKLVQDAYLWVFDRTGIYIATVSMIMTVLAYSLITLERDKVDFITLFGLAIIGLHCMFKYKLQHAGSYEAYNANARLWQQSRLRFYLLCFWIGIILSDVFRGSILGFASSVLITVLFHYVWVCQIRKREPPEKLALVPQGAS